MLVVEENSREQGARRDWGGHLVFRIGLNKNEEAGSVDTGHPKLAIVTVFSTWKRAMRFLVLRYFVKIVKMCKAVS